MFVEKMILMYIWLCFSLILFNIFWILWTVIDQRQYIKRSQKLNRLLDKQLERLEKGLPVTRQHQQYLQKELPRVKYLMAFAELLDRKAVGQQDYFDEYLRTLSPIFEFLARKYQQQKVISKSYFAHVLAHPRLARNLNTDALAKILFFYLQEDSIHCQANVMKALFSFGDVSSVMRGIRILDRLEIYFHGKLLTDGLLTFQGSHQELSQTLWKNLFQFRIPIQVALIDYLRFTTGAYQEELAVLMGDASVHPEVQFAIIRYFTRYPFPAAREKLLAFLQIKDKDRWQYPALAATALAAYPDQEVAGALQKALSSSNWYIRYNAAKSLTSMQMDLAEIAQVINGDDRFAREILQYFMEYNPNFKPSMG